MGRFPESRFEHEAVQPKGATLLLRADASDDLDASAAIDGSALRATERA